MDYITMKRWLENRGCTTVVPCKDDQGNESVSYHYDGKSYPPVKIPSGDRIIWPAGSPMDLVMAFFGSD
jgi:hypothetical protein